MEAENRGSIAFFSTYRPPAPLDIFSSPIPPVSKIDERQMTDQVSYNYNGQSIPMESLKKIFQHRKLGSQGAEEAIIVEDEFSGMAFVSERETLETLHFCLYQGSRRSKVYSFSELYDKTFGGIRMEDSARFAGDYLIYISTIDPLGNKIQLHRQPWTVVYKLNLITGENEPLTPTGQADLSPSVSPSGKKIAIASFGNKGGWNGEIEDLKTDIYVMNIDEPFERTLVIENGGWPTWGSDDVIFFHRRDKNNYWDNNKYWGVFRADISKGLVPSDSGDRVTPEGMSAMTPAAIDATTVAVVIIRQSSSKFAEIRNEPQYRHIEVFDSTIKDKSTEITRKITPKADHFNPFLLDNGKSIGYHRCRSYDPTKDKDLLKVSSPVQDVGLYRSAGVFPTFNKDGSKFAYVDNEFKAVWVGNSEGEMKIVKQYAEVDSVFSPVWNKGPDKDILYICIGHSFQPDQVVEIHAFFNVSSSTGEQQPTQLTMGGFNNAFPSTNPEGTKFVFRSTRDGGDNHSKSLYIMEDAEKGETEGGIPTRITQIKRLDGQTSVDTHCEWSPHGEWIVFSSTRNKPEHSQDDNGLDPGYFAVYLLKVDDPSVVLEVIKSGSDYAGHVNHPFFSPDGMSIVVAADLAAVSVDPISLPFFMHSVRPYGDIFTIDVDWENLTTDGKVVNLKKVSRATHSRYENSTCTWGAFSSDQITIIWDILSENVKAFTPSCPYVHADGGEGWQMTGQLLIPTRRC